VGTIRHYRAFGVLMPWARKGGCSIEVEVFAFLGVAEQVPAVLVINNGWVNQC